MATYNFGSVYVILQGLHMSKLHVHCSSVLLIALVIDIHVVSDLKKYVDYYHNLMY